MEMKGGVFGYGPRAKNIGPLSLKAAQVGWDIKGYSRWSRCRRALIYLDKIGRRYREQNHPYAFQRI